jgi:hypothetical protein
LQLEGAELEELEARKILTKRRRRVGKIEDVAIDIDALFAAKKRFKPDDSTYESVSQLLNKNQPDLQLHLSKQSCSKAASSQTKGLLRQNLLS